jgi:hypothetical protein
MSRLAQKKSEPSAGARGRVADLPPGVGFSSTELRDIARRALTDVPRSEWSSRVLCIRGDIAQLRTREDLARSLESQGEDGGLTRLVRQTEAGAGIVAIIVDRFDAEVTHTVVVHVERVS